MSSAPCFVPPPPPPPPALVPKTTGTKKDLDARDPVAAVTHRWTFLSQNYPVAIVKYFNLNQTILQEGPLCGLVALVMIARSLGSKATVEEAFELAKQKEFTSFGEIFDVHNMKILCSKIVGRVSTVLDFPTKSEMKEDLIKGKIFMVPYDADSNHEPCKRNGRKAHWAVIFGILLMRADCFCLEGLEKLSTQKPIYRAERGYDCELDGDDFLFARQGKSLHVGVWKYDDLRDSCLQLNEATDKLDGMVLPTGGIQQGLKGKVLRLEL